MSHLIIFVSTTDGTIDCVMSDTWCQIVWHLISVAESHTYPMLWGFDTSCGSLYATLPTVGLWAMCSEHQELWKGLFKMEVRGVEQDLIQYVGQLELPNVPVEGWVIGPDVYGILDDPCHIVSHNGEIVHPSIKTCDVVMVINGRRNHEPSPNVLADSPYLLLITL